MAWTTTATILSENNGIGSFDSAEFVPAEPPNPQAGDGVQVFADVALHKRQNPDTRFSLQVWTFIQETQLFAKVAESGFIGDPAITADTPPTAIGVEQPYWGRTMKAVIVKHSGENVTLKIREGQDD